MTLASCCLKRVSEGVEYYLDLLASLHTEVPNGVCRVCC